MDPESTRGIRAGIVARARFIEDLVAEQGDGGVGQSPPSDSALGARRAHTYDVDCVGDQCHNQSGSHMGPSSESRRNVSTRVMSLVAHSGSVA